MIFGKFHIIDIFQKANIENVNNISKILKF